MLLAGGLLGLVLWGRPVQADTFRLGIEPSFPPEQAREVYQPLIDYLNARTGHRFELVLARNYHAYWRNLRENQPLDFAYDEAHFADYRIQHQHYRPLVRTAEPTVYALLAQPEYEGGDIKALVGKPVACMPSPSLGFALLGTMYDNNPLVQPSIRSEASSWRDGVEMVFAGEVDGAMVPARLAETYYNLVTLAHTDPVPGRLFSAAPEVPEDVVGLFSEAILALHDDPQLYDVLAELGASRFEPATAEEYAGHEKILSGFYGYRNSTRAGNEAPAPEDVETD